MAAGGMGRATDVGRGPLSARRRGAQSPPPAETTLTDAGRPCWVLLAPGDHPGQVYAWRKDVHSQSWEALLVAWVPAESLRPR